MLMQRMTRTSRRDVDSTVHIFEVENIGGGEGQGRGSGGGLRKSEASYFLHIEPDD